MTRTICYMLFLLVFCVACNQKNAQKIEDVPPVEEVLIPVDTVVTIPEKPAEPIVVVELLRFKKTACYGRCPVYEVSIQSDGKATYHGKRFVEMEGQFQATLNEEKLGMIMAKAKEYQYFSFANEYPEDRKMAIVDLPMTVTAIRDGEMMKEIKTRNGTPQKLQDFQAWLEQMINEIAWEKTKK